MTRASAGKLCTTARLVHRHQQTAKALDVGDVTVAHVGVLAAAVRRREALYPEHEDALLEAAPSLTPDDLVMVARQWRELADEALTAADAAAAHASRFLHVSPTLGGGRIDGFLDPDATAMLIEALDALVPPDPAGTPDPRPKSVRNADALGHAGAAVARRSRAGRTHRSLARGTARRRHPRSVRQRRVRGSVRTS